MIGYGGPMGDSESLTQKFIHTPSKIKTKFILWVVEEFLYKIYMLI